MGFLKSAVQLHWMRSRQCFSMRTGLTTDRAGWTCSLAECGLAFSLSPDADKNSAEQGATAISSADFYDGSGGGGGPRAGPRVGTDGIDYTAQELMSKLSVQVCISSWHDT